MIFPLCTYLFLGAEKLTVPFGFAQNTKVLYLLGLSIHPTSLQMRTFLLFMQTPYFAPIIK